MMYKSTQKQRDNALNYYYKNRDKVLKYQIERLNRMYQEDKNFKVKRKLRDKSRKGKKPIRDLKTKCSFCNCDFDLQRHHPTYNSTEFIVLCRSCHNKLHQELKSIKLIS